jgi:predicted AAA+ superfamily ATPase
LNFRLDLLSLSELHIEVNDGLAYGQLPAICKENDNDQKELELRSYVENYIEEEIRKETRFRSIAPFYRFIELAAIQSGQISNFKEISKQLGPTVATIQSNYQILEDTLFVERIDPYLKYISKEAKSSAPSASLHWGLKLQNWVLH